MNSAVPNLLLAGVALALLEVAWVLARAGSLFLSFSERFVFGLASVTGTASCVLVFGLMIASCTRVTRADPRLSAAGRALLSAAAGALSAALLWSISSGRRVHDLPARPFVVAVLSLLAALALWFVLRALARGPFLARRGFLVATVVSTLACGALLAIDALLLPRGYPAFHLGLQLIAVLVASCAGLLAPPLPKWEHIRAGLVAAAVAIGAAPFVLAHLAAHPTASFAVYETAPFTSRLMEPFAPRARLPKLASDAVVAQPVQLRRGVDLRDRDVLLITVDAMRADLLRAYGGHGLTPEIDRIAENAAVFTRAYTPAPHTSYALASLLTGKFVKPLIELGGKLGNPPTLPDRLRRYGYRTAAFYPPAVFFVDGSSFEALQQRAFGFEYRKEMFASAEQRVQQLDAYLREAEPKRPLFVWVHLFEPHEPYDPPPELAHDGSERGRYEAEVRACDRAIGKLVAQFRAARPRATVIISADHGEEFGDHGGSFHGSSLYDEQVRIPLVWSSPGVVPAQRIAAPVELTDLGTTILSTAAIPRDAHMRGDDLSALLAGHTDAAPPFAFASIEGRHMITDGRLKAICGVRTHCALFDLVEDPLEKRNVAATQPAMVQKLQGALDAFLASVPRAEALAVSAGVALPEALARAKLGGAAAAAELIVLLKDERPAVRAEAARVLGERGLTAAVDALERTRRDDPLPSVRAEATIASLRLGRETALNDALTLLHAQATPEQRTQARLAAIALANFARVEALPILDQLARDDTATELDRLQAIHALPRLRSPGALEPLLATLEVVRLREASAEALGALGDSRALAPLRAQLSQERYPPSRKAEAEALRSLGDPDVAALVRVALGMESSIPGGVRLLSELGQLEPASRQGAMLRDDAVRKGNWHCRDGGCQPEADAQVVLPKRGALARDSVRVVIWFRHAEPAATLLVDGERFALQASEGQLSFVRSSSASATRFSLSREGSVEVMALAVVPSVSELPPPAPEPWDAGLEASGEDASDASSPSR